MNSVSAKKIKPIEATTPTCHEPITGYRLMDMEILASIFCLLLCPSCCKRHLKLSEMNSKKKGLSSLLLCQNCSYFEEFCTSRSKDNSYDVNKRAVYSMRACGQGYAGLETFTSLMNTLIIQF